MSTRSTLRALYGRLAGAIDRRFGWDRLPVPAALAVIEGLRDELRRFNLHDTGVPADLPLPKPDGERHLVARTVDGTFNDLQNPLMGAAGARFGRNVPLSQTYGEREPELFTPNPRTVSRDLLTRTAFTPAQTLNVLAAAWLQFETRDWFSHGTLTDDVFRLPRPPGDDWPEEEIRLPRTPPDPSPAAPGRPATYRNRETHWWDASQVYGSNATFQQAIRTGRQGKVAIGDDGLISADPALLGSSGGVDGWWLGLELLHTVFMREHNAICDRLHAEYPSWSDDDLFDKARLINAALMAKIHTVEWTTAILGHPALQIGMRANWFGIAGERIRRLFGRLGESEILSGIPGSPTDHHGVPYAITEEFVSVYRMHPLVPDDYVLRGLNRDALGECEFLDLAGLRSRETLQRHGAADLLYSLGVANPGAVTLHNYPRFMQRFRRDDGMVVDLGAIDILRSRERGVPRYNEFRRLLRMNPVRSFAELGGHGGWEQQLASVYDDVEQVDLSVGLYAEKPPAGFGFSDTAFRIFILMASRRLKSDRFFTDDFTVEMYTPVGMQWLDESDMRTVLLRHYPALGPALRGSRNAFAPWPEAGR